VDRSVDLPPQDEIGNLGVSKVIRADQKRFFFDLGSNNRGHFLRISEVCVIIFFVFFLCFIYRGKRNFCCKFLLIIAGRRF